MHGVAAQYWNQMAARTRHLPWRRLFSMGEERAISDELDRLYQGLVADGLSHDIAHGYLHVAPLLHEVNAIASAGREYPVLADALPLVRSIGVALVILEADCRLDASATSRVVDLLHRDPAAVLPPMPAADQEAAWDAESDAMADFIAGDWEVADAAELPDRLVAMDAEGESSAGVYDEWYEWMLTNESAIPLALEQCCDDGEPLDKPGREARMRHAPEWLRIIIDAFWHQCPADVAPLLAFEAYWLVRAERGRRCGWPDWSPRFPVTVRAQVPQARLLQPLWRG